MHTYKKKLSIYTNLLYGGVFDNNDDSSSTNDEQLIHPQQNNHPIEQISVHQQRLGGPQPDPEFPMDGFMLNHNVQPNHPLN